MKNFFLCLALVLFALPAWAGSTGIAGATFQRYSGASFTGSATAVNLYRTKSVAVSGHYTVAGAASNVFGNFTGTIAVQCAPTSNGPWTNCVQQDGTAISFTAPGVLSWDDAFAYIRVVWTKTKHMISVYAFGNQY